MGACKVVGQQHTPAKRRMQTFWAPIVGQHNLEGRSRRHTNQCLVYLRGRLVTQLLLRNHQAPLESQSTFQTWN